MSKLTVENVYTRHKAKELTKQHFWKLFAMTVIVVAIAYAIAFGGVLLLNLAITGTTTTSTISLDAADAAYNTGNASSTIAAALEAANNPFSQQSSSAGFVIGYIVLIIIQVLISSGLTLGLTSAMIDLCRGEKITVGQVFCRMNKCHKALGLSLWVGLKTILWALPGYIAIFAAAFATMHFATLSPNNEGMVALLTVLPLLALILVLALVIPAVLRYMLSTYVLADEPETSVFTCVKDSKALMKGHKWQAFKLGVPTIFIMYLMLLLAIMVVSLILALVSEISSVLTGILAVVLYLGVFGLLLYYGIRLGLSYCLFYLNRENENAPMAEPIAEAAEE